MFFFLPIGHEDSKTRRFPVSTVIVILACFLAFGQTWPRFEKESGEAMEALHGVRRELSQLVREENDDSGLFAEARNAVENARDFRTCLLAVEGAISRSEELGEESPEALKAELQRTKRILENGVFHQYGLVPAAPRLHAFLTHMFLHGGYLHLISNLIFLLLVGPTLEDLWGRAAFLVVYLISGVAAAIGFMLVSGPIPVPLVGASGAIAGLTGAFLVTFTHTRIKMLGFVFLLYIARAFTFTIPAWVFLPLWIGLEIAQGIMQIGSVEGGDGVAHWAHIAGFFFGAGVPFAFRWTGLDRKIYPVFAKNDQGKEVRVSDGRLDYLLDPRYKKGLRLREEGDYRGALEAFRALIGSHPHLPGPQIELAEVHKLDGDPLKHREALLLALTLAARGKEEGFLPIFESLRAEHPRAKVPPECLFKAGLAFERAGKSVDALECLRKFVDLHPQHPLWAQASARLADIQARWSRELSASSPGSAPRSP